jgi:tetratricopeptide (TPR) repeat protein
MEKERLKCSPHSSVNEKNAIFTPVSTADDHKKVVQVPAKADSVEEITHDNIQEVPDSGCTLVSHSILPYCFVVCLSLKPNELDASCYKSITQLRSICSTIELFTDSTQCVVFLEKTKYTTISLIVSDVLSEQIVPVVQELSQLNTIYLLCSHELKCEQPVKEWRKVKGVFNQIGFIYHEIKQGKQQMKKDVTPISILLPTSDNDMNRLNQSFMYSQLLKEILLSMNHDDKAKQTFIELCRVLNNDNEQQRLHMDKFEREYDLHSPIWWYTKESFIFSTLNRALRTQDNDVVMKMGYFIRDLHRQLEQLHVESNDPIPPIVYRGTGLLNSDFDKLKERKGCVLSFNNFLSTSTDEEVAKMFAESAGDDPTLTAVVFTMKIDPAVSSTPFALVEKVGHFSAVEKEIFFAMHTVFRIDKVDQVDDRLWKVDLSLTQDTDEQLTRITEHIRKETRGSTGSHRLGQLMIKVGLLDKAEEIYRTLEKTTFDHNWRELAHIHHTLGYINFIKGAVSNALSHNRRSLDIKLAHLTPDDPELSPAYNNIGSILCNQNNLNSAKEYYERALNIVLRSPQPDRDQIATAFNNISQVYELMGNYSDAHSYCQKALEMKKTYLPREHPSLANTCNSIGSVLYSEGNFDDAVSYFKRALVIQDRYLPPDHLSFITTYNNIGAAYRAMGDHSSALSYYTKASEVHDKSISTNHQSRSVLHNNIGDIHQEMGNYSAALSWYLKALESLENSLLPLHPLMAIIYGNIGSVHQAMDDPTTALPYFLKACKIQEASLTHDHPSLIGTYNNIGGIHHAMEDHTTALLFFEKALSVGGKSLPDNHPLLATTYNNIGSAHQAMQEYSAALVFYEKALEIKQKSLPSNHTSLTTTYNNIGAIHFMMENYSNALVYYHKALDIREKSLPDNHPDRATTCSNIGEVHRATEAHATALIFFEKALDIQQNVLPLNYSALALAYNKCGMTHNSIGDHIKALECFQKAIETQEKSILPNHLNLIMIHNSMATVHYSMKSYSTALSHFEKALENASIALQFDHVAIMSINSNIGKMHQALGDLSAALTYFEKALDIQKNHPLAHSSRATILYNMACVLEDLHRYGEAIEHAYKAVEISHSVFGPNHPQVRANQDYLDKLRRKLL